MSLSPAARAVVDLLGRSHDAVEPRRFPADPQMAAQPGIYGWWADRHAVITLGEAIGAPLPPLIYVGQAGATKWPSGTRSSATLASRIGRQHMRGNARSSTFRLTISSLLLSELGLVVAGGGRLDRASNTRVSAWIADHLRVSIAPHDDRDTLGAVESEVVAHLDPPLNLGHCLPSAARARLTELRRLIRSAGSS
ncbi:MAG TPA: hypothetical protein VKB57_00415 [Acidimicrobiales bacterium]|nr:hypothetical protein [Acidimicrobiales bacterium]